jgi:hypothetical protein
MKSIFMEHPFDVKYGQQFKMHFHAYIFFLLLFPASTLHNNKSKLCSRKKCIHVRRIFLSQTRNGTKRKKRERGAPPKHPKKKLVERKFAAKFMFCECYYAKGILLLFAANKEKRNRKKRGKKFHLIRVNNIEKYVLDLVLV